MSEFASTNLTFGHRFRSSLIFAVLSIGLAHVAVAESYSPVDFQMSQSGNATQSSGEEATPVGTQADDEKLRSVSVGVIILSVITATGLILVFAVILWGRRLKRRMQHSPPKQTVVDDLWYLRSRNRIVDVDSETVPGDGDS